jgi:hypothetical protein
MIGVLGFDPGEGWEFFSSAPRPERLWDPPSLLSNGYQGLFPCGQSGRDVKLTTHLHLVPRSKNEWSYTSTPQYVFMEWCLVKHRDNFTFTFISSVLMYELSPSITAPVEKKTRRHCNVPSVTCKWTSVDIT